VQSLRSLMTLSLECSITGEVYVDPVLAPDDHTYERAAIVEWLKNNDISPLTGAKMPRGALRPNWAIKTLIEQLNSATAEGGGAGSG